MKTHAAKPSVISCVAETIKNSDSLNIVYDPPADGPRDATVRKVADSSLHVELKNLLGSFAPDGLFTHQHLAIESVLDGHNTIAATRTSSGKSLIFALPALDALCRDSEATSLFLYPQKALANDQLIKLRDATSGIASIDALCSQKPHLISRYDGSTPNDQRKSIREQVQLLLTNPDMLHLGILQNHQTSWARFFANLKYVAIDECHEYRGIFGTNVAYVLRRLRQICRQHGSDPRFIATSATVADPQEHLRKLVGCDFELVDASQDGSKQGQRKFWMVDGTEHYYDAGRKLAVSLVEKGLNVIVFCPSRVTAERMLARLKNRDGELDDRIAVYRSGLTGSEREEIESNLRSGRKKLVFSTSALELGIDIGCLDVVICMGLPNSMMSLWQRAGRVARAGREGAIVLIPSDSPLDTYFAQHPEELFARNNESLALNLENERVSCQHYACAVHESGGGESGLQYDLLGEQIELIQTLRNSGKLERQEFYLSNPHIDVSLRNTGEKQYQVMHNQDVIGEIGSFHLLREAPRNALYRHNGKNYRVKDVIQGKCIVRVVPEFTFNETVSFIQKSIKQKRVLKVREFTGFTLSQGKIEVNEYLVSVTEKDKSGKTVRVYQPTGMPNHRLPTEGVSIAFKDAFIEECRPQIDIPIESVIHAIERLSAQLFPTISGPCDSQDYSSATDRTKSGALAIYLYDNVYDGVNLTELAFDLMPELLQKVDQHIRTCTCPTDSGCVRCVLDPRRESSSSKSACLSLVRQILDRLDLESPDTVDFATGNAFEQQPADIECRECKAKVLPTAKFCSECGAKNPGDKHVD